MLPFCEMSVLERKNSKNPASVWQYLRLSNSGQNFLFRCSTQDFETYPGKGIVALAYYNRRTPLVPANPSSEVIVRRDGSRSS